MTQSADGDRLLHAGSDAQLLTHLGDAMPTNRLFAVLTRKQPVGRSFLLPILSQHLEQSGRQHHVAILLPLALVDADRCKMARLRLPGETIETVTCVRQ